MGLGKGGVGPLLSLGALGGWREWAGCMGLRSRCPDPFIYFFLFKDIIIYIYYKTKQDENTIFYIDLRASDLKPHLSKRSSGHLIAPNVALQLALRKDIEYEERMRKWNLVRRDDSFSLDKKHHNVGVDSGKRMAIHI